MAAISTRCLIVLFLVACVGADDIDVELSTGMMLKMLREMANQTKSDTLNLPANATSIRENITDTFRRPIQPPNGNRSSLQMDTYSTKGANYALPALQSPIYTPFEEPNVAQQKHLRWQLKHSTSRSLCCENRTYGYYADVDNECQLFHVCLPSQTPSGRNVTYKWSFICPAETIFNQEVLVCTRPIDSIPCEESEMYYDVNMEFGKIPNDTKKEETTTEKNKKLTERVRNNQKRKQNIIDIRQHNIVPEEILTDLVNEELNKDYGDAVEEKDAEMNPIPVAIEIEPQMIDDKDDIDVDANSRLASERSMRIRGRMIGRGNYRFKNEA